MKMKIDNNIDIDSYLRNDCDLGYLLDYLSQRKANRDTYWLPIIDVLRLVPEFEAEVIKIRNDLKIDPQKNIKQLERIIGKDNILEERKQIARGLKLLDLDDKTWNLVDTQIQISTRKHSPELIKRVSKIKLPIFDKFQPPWHEAIESYILFEIIHITPLIFRRQTPEIQGKIDSKTREPYVEMRIYANTDISVLRKINWWKKIQKSLPNYLNVEKWNKDTILKGFLRYVLRERTGLPNKRIDEWLKRKKFDVDDYQYASQELNRFKALLKQSSK